MYTNLYDCRRITIYVDEWNNLAIFPICKNPYYIGDDSIPDYVIAKVPLELSVPYTVNDVADIIEKGIMAYNQCEPYTDTKKTIEEYYYNIKGFKTASLGKKCISVGWDDIGGKYVHINLPSKRGKYYWGMKSVRLSDDADWTDFAQAVIELINMDLTQLDTYKTFKSKLNI